MLIAQDSSACNNAESKTNKISLSGNIVPHSMVAITVFSQVKAGIVRLEKAGLGKRDLRTVRVYNRVFNNELFSILNVEGVLKLTEYVGAKKFAFKDTNDDEGYDENSSDNNDKKYLRKKSRSNTEKNNLNKNSKQLELAT